MRVARNELLSGQYARLIEAEELILGKTSLYGKSRSRLHERHQIRYKKFEATLYPNLPALHIVHILAQKRYEIAAHRHLLQHDRIL